MRIAITGSSGFIGSALTARLAGDGHAVVPVVRGEPRPGAISWDPAAGRLDPRDLSGIDAVVNLSGAGIGDRRWTPARTREIVDSRIKGTTLLAAAITTAEAGPSVLISGSAIGYYGSRGDELLTEESSAGTDFLAQLCVDWEEAATGAERSGVRVARIRTGIVLDGSGGVLKRMVPLFKLGVGGRLGPGTQWMSWITLADHVEAVRFLLTHDLAGPVDLTAPEPVTNAQLTKALGAELHRPTFLPVPALGPRLLLGRARADNLLFASQRVLPTVLQDAGFEFQHPLLSGALTSVLG